MRKLSLSVFKLVLILFCLPIMVFSHGDTKQVKYIENQGQWQSNILYKANIPEGVVYLENNLFTYSFYDSKKLEDIHHSSHNKEQQNEQDLNIDGFSFKVELLGVNKQAVKHGSEILPEYHNYFIGNDKKKWKGKVPIYNVVNYSSIYNGIDLKIYSQNIFFKYDFIVAPNANPHDIQLQYNGVNPVLKDDNLRIDIGFNTIIEQKPIAYQIIKGEKIVVDCEFTLSNDIVSFKFPNGYNKNYILVIDPVLVAATLSGTIGTSNYGHTATYGNGGEIFTGAICFGTGYPTTVGAFQVNHGGSIDIAISKLNPDGSALIWATYIGGGSSDYPHSMIANNLNELYVYGTTSSNDYPTSTNAFSTTLNGASDIIVTHLTQDGTNIIGSTYIGGNADDGNNSTTFNYGDNYRGEIIVDSNGNAYVASSSNSPNFPTSAGCYQSINAGGQDGVVFKMNPDLSILEWSTYLGSAGGDAVFGIRLDNNNNTFITGTAAANFPTTTSGATPNFIGGTRDAFITKLNPTATTLLASSYFGSIADDASFFLDIDANNDIYIYGQNAAAIPITSGCYGVANSSQFIAKFSPDLTNIQWQTTIGSGSVGSDFVPIAFMVDINQNIYLSGHSAIQGLFVTPNAFYNGTNYEGFYLMTLDPDAVGVNFATYYTANHVDGGTSRFDPSGTVYQAVCSCGPFATTPNAYATTSSGGCDIGVFKIDFELVDDSCISPVANLPDTINICDTSITLTADQAYAYLWSTGETTQSIIVNQSGDYWVQVCRSELGEVLVYENDFNSFIGSEWSDNTTSTYNSTTVLGNFGNSTTSLSLSDLPTHTSIKAVFDLYLLDSWDGNAGPDIWGLSIDGSSTINTTFANINFGGGIQSYPANYPSTNAPLTGVNQMGLPNICYTGINSISSMYKIDSPFSTHSATSVSINFSASGLESSCNESWAIDSVKVYVDSALSCCATEFVHVELTAPNANLGPDIFTCDSIVTLTANSGYKYLWSTGDTTQSIIIDTTGNYQVEVCDLASNTTSVIYSEDFEGVIGNEWNSNITYSYNSTLSLGRFNNDTISLNLSNLPCHDSITVKFDLYLHASWDGNGIPICCGPDLITLRTDGIDMMHATFSNTNQLQSYPDDYPVNNPQWTGVFQSWGAYQASLYKISKTISHSNSNAIIDFIGSGLQGFNDENWAMDNVEISIDETSFNACCCATEDINVQIKCPPTTAIINSPTCNAGADGSIDLTLVDGTLPQTVVWQNSNNAFISNMPNITYLIAGEYIVSTTCGINCPPVIDTFIVPEPPALVVPGIKDDVSCFGADDGSINIDISALVPPAVSTDWTGPNNFSSNLEDINNLPLGMYSVLVTDIDDCFITEDFEIKEPDSILPNPLITNVTCNGDFDGSVLLSITGGTEPYNVNWGTANPLNLYAGTYPYTITDSNNCILVGGVIISEPDPIIPSPITTSVICHGDSNGTAMFSPTGGTPPYTISWGASNPSFLPSGLHFYTITDTNNCQYPGVVNISQPAPIVVFPTQQNVSCYGDFDGWCTMSIIGGGSPYIVDWYGEDSLSLSAGTYLYSVSDVNNCILTDSVVITQPDSLKVSYTTTHVQCNGEPTGAIDVSVLFVNPLYSFNWSNPNDPTFIATTEDINNLYAGTYLLIITDADSCEAALQIIVNQPTAISHYLDIKTSNYTGYDIACKGDNSGWISVNVNGGYIPFSYLWSTGATTDSIFDLFTGIYTLTITDGLGCTETVQYSLLEPATNLTSMILATTDYNGFNISCFNGSDGGIREIPSGGVPPYAWVWDGTQGGEYLINQMVGYHHVELYDNNNCFWEDNITLTEPPALDIQKISVTDTCDREVGEAYAAVSGGISVYQYQWSSGDTLSIAVSLAEGNYQLIVTDDNGCIDTAWYNIDNLPAPLIDFSTFPKHKRFFEQLDDPFVFIDNTIGFWQNVEYWYWDFGDNNFGIDSIAFHSYHDTGMYDISLIIVTEYNCVDTITKSVLVDDYNIYIPNAFTPDYYDETNNVFYVYGYGINRFVMKIYSSWGELLFESYDMKKGWDGRKQGHSEICPTDTYVYYIEVENIYGEIFKFEGQVMLIR